MPIPELPELPENFGAYGDNTTERQAREYGITCWNEAIQTLTNAILSDTELQDSLFEMIQTKREMNKKMDKWFQGRDT